MSHCTWMEKIEAYHDGEAASAAGVAEHLEACPDCREYLDILQQVSARVAAVRQAPEIADAQFRVFMDGVRAGIEAKPSPWALFWSRVSLAAAGFVLVVALSYIVTSGPVRTWAGQFFEPGSADDIEFVQPAGAGGELNPSTRKDVQ